MSMAFGKFSIFFCKSVNLMLQYPRGDSSMVNLGNDWDEILKNEFSKPYYKELRKFLKAEYQNHTVYPPMNDIFNALRCTSFADTKVVIIGQDPYHGAGQAHGMCFSVKKGTPPPPSLQNIFKEIHSDLGIDMNAGHGELTAWAKQGVVFLLWGAHARKKASVITNPIHYKLTAPHPSPLSAYNGFFGCKHFSKTNELLTASGQTPIDWHLD